MTTETTASPGTETAVPETGAAVTTETTTETTTTAPASATAETKAADTTLLTGEVADKTVTAPADWPTDWRAKLAGEDKKVLERLGRFGSPADLLKSYNALEQRLSSGEMKKVLPKDAKPEEVAAWRKENGLPENGTGYLEKLALPDGVVLGEADKPLTLGFAEAALKGNVSPEQFSGLVAKYYEMQDKAATQRAEADRDYRQKSEDDLRGEWGADYRANLNAVKNLLAGMPEGAADNFLGGRLADGTRIGDNPGIVRWMSSMSRELNPAATLMPAGMGDVGKGVNDRITEIEKLMQTDRPAYFRNEPMQEEYRRLLEARDRMKSRAA